MWDHVVVARLGRFVSRPIDDEVGTCPTVLSSKFRLPQQRTLEDGEPTRRDICENDILAQRHKLVVN